MSKRIFATLVVAICMIFPYTANAAKEPDCEWSGYGCTVRGYNSGDGTASYSWECEDGPNQWIYFYETGPAC